MSTHTALPTSGPGSLPNPEGGAEGAPAQQVPGSPAAAAQPDDRPIAGYAALIGLYTAGLVVTGVAVSRRKSWPPAISNRDIVLGAIASAKLARLVANDSVTAALRKPFTHYVADGTQNEVQEEALPTAGPMRKAVGELVTCPFCVNQWAAGGVAAGLLLAPKQTRAICALFSVAAFADVLQNAYAGLERESSPPDAAATTRRRG